MFVQKAPAASIEVLAKALLEMYKSDGKLKVIGNASRREVIRIITKLEKKK